MSLPKCSFITASTLFLPPPFLFQDAPIFGRLIQTSDGLVNIGHQGGARLVQTSPLVTRLVQTAPAVTRVVPAAPAITVVQVDYTVMNKGML